MTATNTASLIRSFTNTTEDTVFLVQINGDECSYFAAYKVAGLAVFDSWADADDLVGELTDDGFYAEVVRFEPGDSLDLAAAADAWTE